MIIAQEKRKTNIAEYVLYMWSIENLIRACNFNMDLINKHITSQYQLSAEKQKEVREWYESLVDMMLQQGLNEKGHLSMIENTVASMEELHQLLMNSPKENKYRQLYFAAQPNIIAFKAKVNMFNAGDIKICLEALNYILLMRLAKKEISLATQQAIETFSNLLAALSQRYIDWEAGKLDFS